MERDLRKMQLTLLISGGALAALSFAYVQLLPVSLAASAAGMAMSRLFRSNANRIVEYRDLENMLESLIRQYTESGNLLLSLKNVSSGKYAFSADLNGAISLYNAGKGTGLAFGKLRTHPSLTGEFSNIVEKGLDSGENVGAQLAELLSRVKTKRKRIDKGIGMVSNTTSVNSMGTALFFPLFAGVSLDIIKFAGYVTTPQNSGMVNGLILMFISYILVSNYVTTAFGPRSVSGAPPSSRFLSMSAVGIIAFRIASLLMAL